MTYTAVLFDLFDTLVRFDRDRMPEIRVNGRTVRSTAGHLHQVLRSHAPEISLEACYEALVESWREAERLRAIDYREVPAPERFDHFFRRLALDPARLPPGLGQTLIDTHRSQLGKAAAWINPEGAPLPPGITPPRYELRDLADLGAILGV